MAPPEYLGQPGNGMELADLDTNSGSCGLIGWYPLNLTLPFGVAWPLQAGGAIPICNGL